MSFRKIFFSIFLLLLSTKLSAQDISIFDAEGSADSIPKQYQTAGIQVIAYSKGGFTQYIPALVTNSHFALNESRMSQGGFSLYFGGMSDNEGLYGILCAEGLFTQYIAGDKNLGIFAQLTAGYAQSFYNPLSQFSSIRLKSPGVAASAFLGFQMKTLRWLPPVQLLGGYRYMSVDQGFSTPSVQLSFVL